MMARPVARQPIMMKKQKVNPADQSEEEEFDNYHWREFDWKKMEETNDSVVVFCLECKSQQPTQFLKETSCRQWYQCFVHGGCCCCSAWCYNDNYDRKHSCRKCGSLLWHRKPYWYHCGSEYDTQWEDDEKPE